MAITFDFGVCVRPMIYRDARKSTMEALEKFKWLKLFTRMSDSGTSDIETLEIKQRNLSRNSNGHNFSHGGPTKVHDI